MTKCFRVSVERATSSARVSRHDERRDLFLQIISLAVDGTDRESGEEETNESKETSTSCGITSRATRDEHGNGIPRVT
jgi:hypothetical protein